MNNFHGQSNPNGDYPGPTAEDQRDPRRNSVEQHRRSMGRPHSLEEELDNHAPLVDYRNASPGNPADMKKQRLDERSAALLGHFERDIFQTSPPYGDDEEENEEDDEGDGQEADEEACQPLKRQLDVSLAGLQRMRMRKLQIELINRVMTMHFEEKEPDDWESFLKEYISAVRDYDYIQTCKGRRRDPFVISSSRDLEASFLRLELEFVEEESRIKKGEWSSIYFRKPKSKAVITRGTLGKEENFRQTMERLGMAILGGAFLIGPMWLMVLRNQLYTTLITTTAFVFGFGLTISLVPTFVDGVRVSMEAVLSATAAYAAVLVVFVGTTAPTNASGG